MYGVYNFWTGFFYTVKKLCTERIGRIKNVRAAVLGGGPRWDIMWRTIQTVRMGEWILPGYSYSFLFPTQD